MRRIEARAYKQNETFEAAVRFARSEGIIPAPEPAHDGAPAEVDGLLNLTDLAERAGQLRGWVNNAAVFRDASIDTDPPAHAETASGSHSVSRARFRRRASAS